MINRAVKRLFAFLALASSAGMLATVSTSNNLFLPRAYSANSAREMRMAGPVCEDEKDGWSASLSVAGSYQRNWDQDKGKGLGARPFWSGTNKMTVGAAVAGTAAPTFNLDPWHLGLGVSTGEGSVQLDPVLYQAGADFMLAVQASANEPGFFGRVKAPVAVMSIDPKLTEAGTVTAADYAVKTAHAANTAVVTVYKNLTEAFKGDKTYGDVQKMAYGQINGKQSKTQFGDIELALGYNFINDEDKCLGVAVRASGPTGNKPAGQYVLEPVVGRGGNWGLGGQVVGHICVWEGQSGDKKLNLKLDGNVMHLFKAKSVRSYDIKSKAGSKYMLAATFSAAHAYQNKINNLVNHSSLESESTFGAEGDVSVELNYQTGNWCAGLGYNFWGRSAETLKITGTFAETYGLLSRVGATLDTPQNVPDASINQQGTAAAAAAGSYVKAADLDVAGAQQAGGCSSKVFGHLSYNWMDSDYCPHLGVMGEFELSHSDNNALPQWGVGVEGGVSF